MPATLETDAVIEPIKLKRDERRALRKTQQVTAPTMGAPTIRTADNRAAIIEAIELDGLALSRAAESIGVSASAALEWQAEEAEFARDATRAKGLYLRARLSDLRQVRTKWGCADPKALEIALRPYEEYRVHQVTESRNLSVSVSLSGDQLASLQCKWQQALEDGAK